MNLNINQITPHRQTSQQSLKAEQRVYLYGDRQYAGILIRLLERTYPQKWTVQLDRGGYAAASVEEIFPIESLYSEANESEIPFSEELENISTPSQIVDTEEKTISQLEQKIRILENTVSQLETEKQFIEQEYKELERENKLLKKDLEQAKQIIRRAKDISPLMRLSLKRVLRLARHACMDVKRTVGGWVLKMGDKARKFRRLADIWDILSVDEFLLSDIFPPEKLIAVDLILPPRRRKKPEPTKKKTFPLMRPEDIMRNRTMSLVK